jgi:hypothetical protein
MDGNLTRVKLTVALSFLLLFFPLTSEVAQGTCDVKSSDQMKLYLVEITNYTLSDDNKIYDRFAAGSSLVRIWETAYIKSDESVRISLFSYDDEVVAAEDATVFPTSTKKKGWNETTFRGHPAFEKSSKIISSEYIDYSFDLRVVDGCIVIRGWWHEKIRRYDPLLTLEEGKASVETVLGAVVDEIDGRSIVEAPSNPEIVVLANSIDYLLAQDFFGFLENKGFDVIRATAKDFDQYKGERSIVILGGPDAPEGVGEIVQGVLSEVQENSIREAGARRRYSKINVWSQGQRVTVIAGSVRLETMKSHEENREDVALEIREAT